MGAAFGRKALRAPHHRRPSGSRRRVGILSFNMGTIIVSSEAVVLESNLIDRDPRRFLAPTAAKRATPSSAR